MIWTNREDGFLGTYSFRCYSVLLIFFTPSEEIIANLRIGFSLEYESTLFLMAVNVLGAQINSSPIQRFLSASNNIFLLLRRPCFLGRIIR